MPIEERALRPEVIFKVCKAGLFLTLESETELTSLKAPPAPSSINTAKELITQPPVSAGSDQATVIDVVSVVTLVGARALLGF